ncbi:hypothetical protein H4R19_005169, partial [Coemansia spiralis]
VTIGGAAALSSDGAEPEAVDEVLSYRARSELWLPLDAAGVAALDCAGSVAPALGIANEMGQRARAGAGRSVCSDPIVEQVDDTIDMRWCEMVDMGEPAPARSTVGDRASHKSVDRADAGIESHSRVLATEMCFAVLAADARADFTACRGRTGVGDEGLDAEPGRLPEALAGTGVGGYGGRVEAGRCSGSGGSGGSGEDTAAEPGAVAGRGTGAAWCGATSSRAMLRTLLELLWRAVHGADGRMGSGAWWELLGPT